MADEQQTGHRDRGLFDWNKDNSDDNPSSEYSTTTKPTTTDDQPQMKEAGYGYGSTAKYGSDDQTDSGLTATGGGATRYGESKTGYGGRTNEYGSDGQVTKETGYERRRTDDQNPTEETGYGQKMSADYGSDQTQTGAGYVTTKPESLGPTGEETGYDEKNTSTYGSDQTETGYGGGQRGASKYGSSDDQTAAYGGGGDGEVKSGDGYEANPEGEKKRHGFFG